MAKGYNAGMMGLSSPSSLALPRSSVIESEAYIGVFTKEGIAVEHVDPREWTLVRREMFRYQ